MQDYFMPQDYLLFDLDGTLTDSQEGITRSVAYALEAFGIRETDLAALRRFIGPPLDDSFMEYYGFSAEQARAVLPGCVATRILAYASPEEWRHIFSQRCDEHADPQMAALMRPLEAEMRERGLI